MNPAGDVLIKQDYLGCSAQKQKMVPNLCRK